MCGIFANLSITGARSMEFSDCLERMSHRGPDMRSTLTWSSGAGCKTDPQQPVSAEAWLGHVRLSIIDLSPAGLQPMRSPDGRYVIIFNGEIYNYKELRTELKTLGIHFETDSDTEVLLQVWAHWGRRGLTRLKGMFAFVILDTATRIATLVRDFFGIKPLFYAEVGGGIRIASEVWPLIDGENAHLADDPSLIFSYLRFGTCDSDERTLIEGIKRLPAAHLLEVDIGNRTIGKPECYWKPAMSPRPTSFADAVAETRQRFLDNIRLHLRSDVSVGAALSGGIDSSAIVGAIRHLEPDMPLQCFSYISDDSRYSEEHWVDIVQAATSAQVRKVRPAATDLATDLEALIRHQGEPFGGTSVYAQYAVFRQARADGVVVMLDGQGADELLAGYTVYLGGHVAGLLREGQFGKALQVLRKFGRENQLASAEVAQYASQFVLPTWLRSKLRSAIGRPIVPDHLDADWFANRGADPIALAQSINGEPQSLAEHLWLTVSSTTLPHLLRYEDRNSMAHSLESRVPFLTHDFAEFLLSLPAEYLISGQGQRKHVFREAMKGILPEAIRVRKDKIGFQSTEADWLRANSSLVRDELERAKDYPFFNRDRLISMMDSLVAGRPTDSTAIWRAFNLIVWMRQIRMTQRVARISNSLESASISSI